MLQGYGQSEAGPVISVNLPWNNDRRTVGAPLPGVEARIAEDGEILVRGDLVMDGYWNDPEATGRALRPQPRRTTRPGSTPAMSAAWRKAASSSPTASATSSRRSAATWSARPRSRAC